MVNANKMMTVRDLMTNTAQFSPDGDYWEPALPPYLLWRIRLRDAWAVLTGKAIAIRQTTKADIDAADSEDEIPISSLKLLGPLPRIEDFPPARQEGEVAMVHGKDWVCIDSRHRSYTWSRFDQESKSILSVGANQSGLLGGRGSQVTKEKNA